MLYDRWIMSEWEGSIVARLLHFLTRDLWRIRIRDLPRSHSLLIQPLRVVVRAWRGFDEDKCRLRASALTFYTLLSMVPVAAMAFGVAKGFGLQQVLEKVILERLRGQERIAEQVIAFSDKLLDSAQGGLIAGIGVAVLFWTVIQVLGNIEESFNDIWGVRHPRTLMRKLADYLSIMLICPVLLILSSSATLFIAGEVHFIVAQLSFLGPLAPLIFFSLKILPYAAMWVMFSFVYICMPNTNVKISAGLLGGVAAGTVYQLTQWIYVKFQIGVSGYGAVYGSFAALPLFLAWLELSWTIVLWGAEISFAAQNVATYEFEPECLEASPAFKRLLTLRTATSVVKRFCESAPAPTEADLTRELDIPIRLMRQILFELVSCGVLTEVVSDGSEEKAYHPARSDEELTIKNVIDLLDQKGTTDIPVIESDELEKLRSSLEAFSKAMRDSPANILLKEV